MTTNLKIINKIDVRDIILKELKKKEKIISKEQVKSLIRLEITKQLKPIYEKLDKIRKINQT